ncbi:MAG: RNA-binding transcriptional accessory protein, partial [Muribaculaceae bacterium]|nr:RNA-binding transcriptional accessory protein [Muribaculaceae bacterium]
MDIIQELSRQLSLDTHRVEAVVKLLDDGATIPFISRYRKEVTGGMEDITILAVSDNLNRLRELEKRKQTVIESIEKQGVMTDELRKRIDLANDSTTLEDIYLPYKPRRRTRATIAIENGLEPLAKQIMAGANPRSVAQKYVNDKVSNTDTAIEGASDIIAGWVSEDERSRRLIRRMYQRDAIISSKVIKGKEEEGLKYEQYFDFAEPLKRSSSHRLLAMFRGRNEGILKLDLSIDNDKAIDRLFESFIPNRVTATDMVEDAVEDGYKRLLVPSIENEVMAEAREKAEKAAIETFADNLAQLLMSPPLGRKKVLAVDPGFRTGCKIVCLDTQGNLLYNDVIYPTAPKNDIADASRKITRLVETYKIDAIALGNGTASRETEAFLKNINYPRPIELYVVSEDGASVYSASAIGREEFPDKDVTVRGAVSIGRRLIDPLAELVKIDPKSIGIGQYQHDVDQSALKSALDFTVMNCVNKVGVDVNTASPRLLSYVAGIGDSLADSIVRYRAENGDFTSRKELLKVPRLGAKAFEQSAGFLRIPGGKNPLDNSAVHPESYAVVEKMAKDLGVSIADLTGNQELIKKIDINKYVTDTIGLPSLNDIISELEKPGRDPRQSISVLKFDESVHEISDLKAGMILNGIVNNITDFGVFVDIGVHQSGLVHVSQISDRRITSPRETVKLHQHVRVKVIDVDLKRNRIS